MSHVESTLTVKVEKTRHNFKATPKKHLGEKREIIGMLDEGILGDLDTCMYVEDMQFV